MFCLLEEWAWPTFFLGIMIELDRETIGKIIERIAARQGLELVHWEAVGPQNNFVLRIYIDKPGGVSHGDCELVSNQVGALLDVEDLIPNRYILEVSSPGIERGLYKKADYERFAGSRVKLRISQPLHGQRNFRGKLIGLVAENVSLDADGRGPIEIPFDQIVKANIEYEF
jgi:ribosome maturation factor RimP